MIQQDPAQRSGGLSFYLGVFIIAGSTLGLQILHTRMLSIMSWYFLAFFAISMAMFGMTAGALLIYFFDRHFSREVVRARLVQLCVAFAISTAVGWLFLLTSLPYTEYSTPVMASLVWLKLISVLAPPYVFGGMAVALALTRSPYPIGIVYAVDLAGAAAGCFAVLLVMQLMDGVSAVLAIAALGGLAAVLFRFDLSSVGDGAKEDAPRRFVGWKAVAAVTLVLAFAASFNAAIYPDGGRILFVKSAVQPRDTVQGIYWNSFSRIDVGKSNLEVPQMWGPSPKFEGEVAAPIRQRWMMIDGLAGTGMYRFSGERDELAFLEYDVTNLAYKIRNRGRSAVIGVGGGRDVLSAHYFGFESVTGVEINPIFIDNLTGLYSKYNEVASLDGVRFVVDEARSWFARTDETFDLIQMSLIDTWAATGAGAFTLTENGLYTVEGWKHFLGALEPDGVFTVSRWYAPESPGETGRLISLAKATLFDLGVSDPDQHLYLAATETLSTLIVSRSPLSDTDRAKLAQVSERLEYRVLYSPEQTPHDPILRAVFEANTTQDLFDIAEDSPVDFSPPTDDRPFFFNQLRLSAVPSILANPTGDGGVINGNLVATAVLMLIIFISLVLVLVTIVLPTLPAVRRVSARLTTLGSAYFLLIGLGFMFVEIGLMQRLSIFLGHPVYGLAIALAGIILATGIGSAISERFPLNSSAAILVWTGLTVAYLASFPSWFPGVIESFGSSGIVVRSAVALAAVLPAGVGLGFGFPTGMRLVESVDERPTPWFWAVNGAAGVFASGLAVAIGIFVSVDAGLWVAGACYALIAPIAIGLLKQGAGPLERAA